MSPSSARTKWRQAALAVAAAVVLGGVFMSYLQPALMMELATQLWNCF